MVALLAGSITRSGCVTLVCLAARCSGIAPAGVATASRVTCLAGLSARRPTYLAWRMLPSGVQSANTISATSCGLTQRSGTPARRAQRLLPVEAVANGVFGVSSLSSRCFNSAAVLPDQPVPTLPAGTSWPLLVVHAEQQAADLLGRRIATAVGEAGDHELLALLRLQLQPAVGAARDVRRVVALGDDALELELFGRAHQVHRVGIECGAETHVLAGVLLRETLRAARAARAAARRANRGPRSRARRTRSSVMSRVALPSNAFCSALKCGQAPRARARPLHHRATCLSDFERRAAHRSAPASSTTSRARCA